MAATKQVADKKVDTKKVAKKDAKKKTLSEKAKKKLDKILKAGKRPRTRKVWHDVHFRRPVTQRLAKAPKYPRVSAPQPRAMDKFQVLRNPLTTDTIMKMIEEQNTLVFVTDLRANKTQIKKAFEQLYQTKVASVRTAVTSLGSKKAFIKLPAGVEAVDVASKVGVL